MRRLKAPWSAHKTETRMAAHSVTSIVGMTRRTPRPPPSIITRFDRARRPRLSYSCPLREGRIRAMKNCDAKLVILSGVLFLFAAWQAMAAARAWYDLKEVCAGLSVYSGEAYDKCREFKAK